MLNNPIIMGGGSLPALTNPGTAGDLLSGKQLIDKNGNVLTGTMANRGAVTAALNAGGSYTIPAGYHNGNGKVTANSLSAQTPGNAAAADIALGKTAWANGVQLVGTSAGGGDVSFPLYKAAIKIVNNTGTIVEVYYTDLYSASATMNYQDLDRSGTANISAYPGLLVLSIYYADSNTFTNVSISNTNVVSNLGKGPSGVRTLGLQVRSVKNGSATITVS